MPPGLVEITGVLPFTETIFLWQSIALTAVLILVSLLIAWLTAPAAGSARTAEEFPAPRRPSRSRCSGARARANG